MSPRPPEQRIAPVIEAVDLDATVRWFADELGFRIETVSPADAPSEISMSGLGGRIVIRRADRDASTHLVCASADDDVLARNPLRAPNGAVVEIRRADTRPVVPDAQPSLSIVRTDDSSPSGTGRAGMRYRDLLPDRWGGRFIASHIEIPGGGEVADWVHFHRIRFQMIFCAAGWVEVVYEDQGAPFRLEAGDCVVQPPEIRHRVLRSSPGLDVIEVGCPAVHDTLADHDLDLPTSTLDPERDFGGQRFVRHVAAEAAPESWLDPRLVFRDTGIGAATGGLAGARVISSNDAESMVRGAALTHAGEFVFDVVLAGSADLVLADADAGDGDGDGDGEDDGEDDGRVGVPLGRMDAVAIPPGSEWCWSNWTDDFEFLEVALGADAVRPADRTGRREPR